MTLIELIIFASIGAIIGSIIGGIIFGSAISGALFGIAFITFYYSRFLRRSSNPYYWLKAYLNKRGKTFLVMKKLFINLGILIPFLLPSLMLFGMKLDLCREDGGYFLKIFFLINFILHISAILAAKKIFLGYGMLKRLFVLFMPFFYWVFISLMFTITFWTWFCS